MALALGWLENAGYGGRKGQVQKGFPGNKACGEGERRRRGESICHHPTCYNKEIMSNPTSYPKKRKAHFCSFLPYWSSSIFIYKHPFLQLHILHEFRSI
jgi:hypothetical protein